jgi:hypothetical protein
MLMFISWSIWEVLATPPEPGSNITEHDAIPEKFSPNSSGMTQLRSVFVFSEVNKTPELAS